MTNNIINMNDDNEDEEFYPEIQPKFEAPVNTEIFRLFPTKPGSMGFTKFIRKIIPTNEGMEAETSEALIIANSGNRVKEHEIKGQCEICGGFDNYIYNCSVNGCKRALCLKHVFFFEQDGKNQPYCLEHYRAVVDNFDTWRQYEPKEERQK